MKNHTIVICDYPILSDNADKLLSSVKKYLPYDKFELIYLSTGRSHAEQLNMGICASRTPYILFVDNDVEFTEQSISLFDDLDNFWEDHNYKVGTVCYGHVDEPCNVDETPNTPYNNFFVTSYNKRVGAKFFEQFIKTQCLDVAFFRLVKYLGWDTYAATFFKVAHNHTNKEGNPSYEEYVKHNQNLMVDMFGCATNANPKNSDNWKSFENWLHTNGESGFLSGGQNEIRGDRE